MVELKHWISDSTYDKGFLHIFDGQYDYSFTRKDNTFFYTVHDGLSRGDNNMIEEGEIINFKIYSWLKKSIIETKAYILEELKNVCSMKNECNN
jgi:hypothetical protein